MKKNITVTTKYLSSYVEDLRVKDYVKGAIKQSVCEAIKKADEEGNTVISKNLALELGRIKIELGLLTQEDVLMLEDCVEDSKENSNESVTSAISSEINAYLEYFKYVITFGGINSHFSKLFQLLYCLESHIKEGTTIQAMKELGGIVQIISCLEGAVGDLKTTVESGFSLAVKSSFENASGFTKIK